MAHAAAQALYDGPAAAHDQRDAWLRLQSSLARTLDDLYLFCEDDDQDDLIQSTLRLLEETVDDFRCLASSSTADTPSSCGSGSTAASECSWSAAQQNPAAAAAAAADAAALISRKCNTCSTGCRCSSSGTAADACSSCAPNLAAGGWQPQGSSRLSRSSTQRCNLHSFDSFDPCSGCSGGGNCSSTGLSCSCCDDTAAALSGLRSCGAHSCMPSDALHHQLHNKLSSPHRLRRSPSQTKAASEERHARAERLRERLAEARLTRLQEQLAKQQRAASKAQEPADTSSSPAAAVTAEKHQRSSLLRAAHLRRIRAKAEDESRKVDEVSFINNLTNAGRKADLQQRLEEGEARRAEALAAILAKQQEAAANVREAAERRRAAEAERLAQLEHRQRRKQEVQAKLEEERRAAIAAREAARAHARAVAQQRETAQQQQASLLRDKVNVRLKQAAERRLQHLKLIRERAALGKDFDRRDSFAGGPGSGRQSPVQFDRPAGKASRPLRSPVPPDVPAHSSSSTEQQDGPGCTAGPSGRAACLSKANLQAAALCPAGSVSDASDYRQASVSQGSTAAASVSPAAGLLPSEVFDQLKDHSQSVAAGGLVAAPSSLKSSLKGARRRMAKARYKMQQPRPCFQEHERAEELCQSAEGQQLLAAWAPHLAVLQIQQPVVTTAEGAPAEAAVAAGTPAAVGSDQAAAATPGSGTPTPAGAAGPARQQLCACDSSSKSSSATNSPRSSTSSYTAASVSTSTFSSTIAGSPAGVCAANWVLSRSSSCCDCDSQHSAASTGGAAAAAAGCRRSGAAAEEQQREALAALVASARSHLGKQQLLVGHVARRSGLLYRLCEEVLAACGDSDDAAASNSSSSGGRGSGGGSAWQEAKARQERLQQAHLLELLGRLLELPANLDYLLACGQLLPAFVRCTRIALDQWNGLGAHEPSMVTGGVAASRLSMLLQVLVAVLEHNPSNANLVEIQEQLVGFTVAAGLMARLASVFSLFDQPMQQAARPVPPYVLQCLRLLGGLTAVRSPAEQLLTGRLWPSVTPNAAAVVLEMQATSMAGVLSLLTAVLLNASPTCTPAEASSRALPPNFVEAAHLVMAVLNNVCRMDLLAGQFMLSCSHHRMEFYHLISFLLSYCLSRWPAPLAHCQQPSAAAAAAGAGQSPARPCPTAQQQQQRGQPADAGAAVVAPAPSSSGSSSSPAKGDAPARPPGVAPVLHHPIAQLLNQVLLLIGYFCVQHPSNQAMLTWGRSPSILQRLCSLPQEYLEVPELRAVLMPTLLCVCFGAERSCEIVARHFDLGLLLQYTQQQAAEQQLQQGQQQQQQTPQTRRQRRRQQRSAQREQQQQTVQQDGLQTDLQLQCSEQDLQQQLPAQAQQLLQQVKQCGQTASGAGQDTGSSGGTDCTQKGDAAGSVGGGTGSAAGPESSSSGHKGTHAGRSRHAMFALCRRFPVQLLPAAAQQLQGVCSIQQGSGACSSSSSSSLETCQGGGAAAAAATASACEAASDVPQDCCANSTDDQQLQCMQAQPEVMEPAGAGAVQQQQPVNPVGLQLALQRSPAPKLVQVEVVTCS